MERPLGIRKRAWLIIVIVVAGILIAFFRGPHISNALKRAILPELEAATGHKVIAQKIYLNIFPFFVEAKGLKMFDENGEKLLSMKRVKAYIDISGFMNNKIRIRRLVLKEPDITADEQTVGAILENIRAYLGKDRGGMKVEVLSVEVQNGEIKYTIPERKLEASIQGLSAEILLKEKVGVSMRLQEVAVRADGWPELKAGVSAQFTLKDGSVQISDISISVADSTITASGQYGDGSAELRTKGSFFARTFQKFFGLSSGGEGTVNFSGNLNYRNGTITPDLHVSGAIYLETLMELLHVKDRLEGHVAFDGYIRGPLNDLRAEGTAEMTKGNLYSVDVDHLTCRITYEDGFMRFQDGVGQLYNGSATASAVITLPVVHHYTLDIRGQSIDSRPLFALIGWDPGIAPGKVVGTLHSEGQHFNPSGSFTFRSTAEEESVLGRVRDMTGTYGVKGDILTLSDLSVSTPTSGVIASGSVDLHKETLQIDASLKTADVRDLTLPYYHALEGQGNFKGVITGSFHDPVVTGSVSVSNGRIEHYPFDSLDADVVYRMKLLKVIALTARSSGEDHRMHGQVTFPKAQHLFHLAHAGYALDAALKNADLERFAKIFYGDFSGKGRFAAHFNIAGTSDLPQVNGTGDVSDGLIYDIPFDSARLAMRYASGKTTFSDVVVKRGDLSVGGFFSVTEDGTFECSATSDRFLLSDLLKRKIVGEVVMSARMTGHGTFSDPTIDARGKIIEGTLKGKPVGSGNFIATLKEKRYEISADLLDKHARFWAKGRTDGEMPWEATVALDSGRYDFFLTSVLKDVPEDLILNLNAKARLSGDRNHLQGRIDIKHIVASLYGYSFTNDKEIGIDLNDRSVQLNTISLRSGSTVFLASGGFIIGKEYDLSFEGSSSLAPFKSLSARLGVLKGDADFVLSVNGDWDAPKINGSITLDHGVIGLKEYPYRLSDLKGYLYMDNDRIILKQLAGTVGGGTVDLSGVLYLKRFSFNRFYVEARMEDVSAAVSEDFNVRFNGNLLYKGTLEKQMISGDVVLSQAQFRKRIEWKSWLIQLKSAEAPVPTITNLQKAELNVKIDGSRSILIDNNVARAQGSADMLLRGTLHRPLLFGRLLVDEGMIYFRNNEFSILHASADFTDTQRINPFIDVTAETIVKGHKIRMNLEGQLDRFSLALSSDPPMKETDILAMLTVGQKGSELKGLEGSIGAGEATSFVTGMVQDVLEERVTSITGLDRFQIDPYVSKTTGTVEPRVTVSKRLVGDKVYVTLATPVGSTEEQIVKLEYYLNRNVSLIGIRDERGIIGGDVRFRFEFR